MGQGVAGASFAALALLYVAGSLSIAHLAIGSFVLGMCFAFIGPARQALVGELVPPAQRGNATALALVANNASRIGGPAVAGVLLAWDAAGAGHRLLRDGRALRALRRDAALAAAFARPRRSGKERARRRRRRAALCAPPARAEAAC